VILRFLSGPAVLAIAVWCHAAAGPEGYGLTNCSPASLQTGDVALLTISGTLPPGVLTVEFFPQRIRVLNVTALDSSSLAVQVSVPFDAPTGSYNIIVFSQDGQEAVGTGLLILSRLVKTPRILNAEPLEAQASLSELDLKLHCEGLDSEAIPSLDVRWARGGAAASQIASEFRYAGSSLLLLHVAGTMLPGDNFGTVLFKGQPIFLIKLRRIDTPWSVFGHRPVQIGDDAPGCEVLFLGRGLSPIALAGAEARLSSRDGNAVATVPLDWRDTSRAAASITPLPAIGDYTLELWQNGVVAYQGPLVVTSAEALARARTTPKPDVESPQASEAAVAPATPRSRPNRPAVAKPGRQLPGWSEAKPASTREPKPAPEQGATGQMAQLVRLSRADVQPSMIDPVAEVLRLSVAGLVLPPEQDVAEYVATLGNKTQSVELVFLGRDKRGLLLLFKMPAGGWGSEPYWLLIHNGLGKVLVRKNLAVQPQ
jgi:hypothetical protein